MDYEHVKYVTQKLEKIARDEGLKNVDDIFDLSSFESIKAELAREETSVQEYVNPDALEQEQKALLHDIREFVHESAKSFKEGFKDLLCSYVYGPPDRRRKISPTIVEFLREKKFDAPLFQIADSQAACDILRDCGQEPGLEYIKRSMIGRHHFLVLFQLPKPVAQYWWKGGGGLMGGCGSGRARTGD
ncbi:hypothetical protein A3J43_03435 [Candidatus Uhrbacteria bacterium RIFCSPHIGHO2_12_FULL_54_23]|uniref:Uncharacterized protein n=1 Tax=Candidatus Uhrbacteria bacterium RIFCSPHIGHO2_12_FULL_54_23 TaxID=1802397 RepID=A0A1F7UH76_9BACT|nr:MAG: hypothetical protein A3J43_03435 [Candidatus Uhrbacteria bacterium RIFCSPHIGHO2_12_FULL_54_23]